MKNIKAIINLFGGLASFRHVRLECGGFMPLVVEAIGPGPRGRPYAGFGYPQSGAGKGAFRAGRPTSGRT